VRVVINDLEKIIGHLNGRDLHQHQTSCEALMQASFKLVNDCLVASCWVEKSEHLVASLKDVEDAKKVYDQCLRQFYVKAGDDEVQADEDGMPGRTPSLPDASTMSSSTDNFMTGLEAASALMEENMKAQEEQLERNLECSAKLRTAATTDLLCVEVEQQRHANLEEREEVVKLVEQLGDADAAIATAERARQEVLQWHSDKFLTERQKVEQEQATIEEKIADLTRSWLDLDATRKHFLKFEDWAREERRKHAAKFESDKQWIAITTAKLNEKVKDCNALDSAIQTEVKLIERVATLAKDLVGRYTKELLETMAADFAEQKEAFDSRYEVYYRRQKNLELQMEKKKREEQQLTRQYTDCVRHEDTEGAAQYKQSRATVKARIVVLADEVAKYKAMLASLNEDWKDVFVPRREEVKDYLENSALRLRDQREAKMVDVDSDLLSAADAAAEAERRERIVQEAKLEEERRLLKARVDREQAARNMLTDGGS
jgi:hypothetical protein